MSTDRETTRLVRSWLEEGVTRLPDRVLDAVLDQVPATRQRRAWWPAWRLGSRNVSARLSALTATLALLAVLGAALLPIIAPGVAPQPTPSPSPSPSPTAEASPTEPIETPLPAGTYSLDGYPIGVSFTVPPGWLRCIAGPFEQGVCRKGANGTVQFLVVDNVVADSCTDTLRDPPVGPSVDDLVAALSGLSKFTATAPLDITVDGFAGKEFTLTATNVPGCLLRTWATPDRINGVNLGEANLLRIVDVDGTRVVIAGPYPRIAADTDEAIALMRQIMDSVTFTP